MLFSSLEFIFLFLPITLALYYVAPYRLKNFTVFLSGAFFYAFGEPRLLPLLLLTVVTGFAFGLFIGRARQNKKMRIARIILIFSVAFYLFILGYFKYFDTLQSFIFGSELIGIALPIGISFYTFQAISYLADVYRGEVQATKSLVDFGAYITLFPQLIAGPIVKYSDIESQLRERRLSFFLFCKGLRKFIVGLSKKVILANGAGELFFSFSQDYSYLAALLCLFFFGMQIYFDFSGYSDMAIGLAEMLGFELVCNFNYPYTAKSVSDFWRRWHISLSSFFKEYVYIPLGGSRRGALRTAINIFAVWSLTGIWHGATVNFLLWGVYFAVLLSVEKLLIARRLGRAGTAFLHIYSLFFIFMGWLIFASDGVTLSAFEGLRILKTLFFPFGEAFFTHYSAHLFFGAIPFIIILSLGSTPLPKKIYLKLKSKAKFLDFLLPACAFIVSIAYCVSAGYNPFLYFRF